jgi:hypothetical protein
MKNSVSKLADMPFKLNTTPNELDFPTKAIRPGAYSEIEGYRAALQNYWFSYVHNKPRGPAWKSVEKRTIDVVLASIRNGSITKATVRQSFSRSCERLHKKFLDLVKTQNDGASSVSHSQDSLGKSPAFGATPGDRTPTTPRGSGPTVRQVREALSQIGVGEESSSRASGKRHASKKKAPPRAKTPEYSSSEEEDKHSSQEEEEEDSSSEESSSESSSCPELVEVSATLGKRASPPQPLETLR